jgi:hypothetical protein
MKNSPLRTRNRMISPWITHSGKSPGSWRDLSFQIRPELLSIAVGEPMMEGAKLLTERS